MGLADLTRDGDAQPGEAIPIAPTVHHKMCGGDPSPTALYSEVLTATTYADALWKALARDLDHLLTVGGGRQALAALETTTLEHSATTLGGLSGAVPMSA